ALGDFSIPELKDVYELRVYRGSIEPEFSFETPVRNRQFAIREHFRCRQREVIPITQQPFKNEMADGIDTLIGTLIGIEKILCGSPFRGGLKEVHTSLSVAAHERVVKSSDDFGVLLRHHPLPTGTISKGCPRGQN